MKTTAKTLFAELKLQLKKICQEEKKPIKYSKQAVTVILDAIEKLKAATSKYNFKSQKEEIEFFKTIKPKFTAKLIYYTQIYHIETAKSGKAKKYYHKHLKKINNWYTKNAYICQYLKAKSTYADQLYFLRNNFECQLSTNANILNESFFTTAHDQTIARYKANKALKKYLKAKGNKKRKQQPAKQGLLTWTAPKVALIELLYALHTAQAFNNGNASLNQIAIAFETLFNTKLGQYHRSYYEICARKTIEPTHFLNTLKEKLTIRIFETDAK